MTDTTPTPALTVDDIDRLCSLLAKHKLSSLSFNGLEIHAAPVDLPKEKPPTPGVLDFETFKNMSPEAQQFAVRGGR